MMWRSTALCAALAALVASASASDLSRAPPRAPRPVLHYRGGAGGAPPQKVSALGGAVKKLCTAPSLIASTGTKAKPTLAARHLRGVVFGGMDGILTTFALLAAFAGTGQNSAIRTIVVGVSTVLADALSMGAGEYLSAKAEIEAARGKFDPDEAGPLEKGAAMFAAFGLFGCMPLLGYVATALLPSSPSSFPLSVAITACTLFALGCVKAIVAESGVWWLAGMEVTGIGGAAAMVAYYTAQLIDHLIGGE